MKGRREQIQCHNGQVVVYLRYIDPKMKIC